MHSNVCDTVVLLFLNCAVFDSFVCVVDSKKTIENVEEIK